MEFFIENKAKYKSFIRIARTLCPITEEEEKFVNEIIDIKNDSDDQYSGLIQICKFE